MTHALQHSRYRQPGVIEPRSMAGTAVALLEPDLWLAASELRGLADGDAVTLWPDISGNGRHAFTSASTKNPLYKTGIINGLPVVRFDATDDTLITGLTISVNPFTVAVVYKWSGAGSAARRVLAGSSNWLIGPYSALHQYYNGAFINGGAASSTPVYIVLTQTGSGANFRVNGVTAGTNGSIAVPGTIQLGAGGAFPEVADSDVAEVLAWSRELSGPEISTVHSYFQTKYAL